jgi:hypothetical protein
MEKEQTLSLAKKSFILDTIRIIIYLLWPFPQTGHCKRSEAIRPSRCEGEARACTPKCSSIENPFCRIGVPPACA